MNSVFKATDLTPKQRELASSLPYNRQQRKTRMFVLMDRKGRFAQWDREQKKTIWIKCDPENAPKYSFRNIIWIWDLNGGTDHFTVKMRWFNTKKELILV